MRSSVNQSRTKAKILLIAMVSIALVCLLLVGAVIEIRKYNQYTKLVSTQEQQIKDLENLKDYYNSSNYDDNAARDDGNYADGDLVFEEE